ncbi:WD40-repeat-containing domain protein [Obelidium mucronatum]|nr:WD40-repeat-containing domain protein [Obelidium mucronatum]
MNYLNGLEISQSGGIPPPMPPSHQHQQYYPYQHPYQYPADPRYPMYSPIQQFPPQFPPVQHYHPGYAPQHTQSYAPPSSLRPQSSKKNLVGDSTIKRKRMDMETGNPASQPLQPQPARQPDFQEEMLEEETFQDDVIPEESESEETQKRQLPHHGHNQSTNAQSLKILAHSAACLEEHNTQMVSHKNTKKAKLVSADSSAVTPQSGPKDKELLNSYFPSSNVATLRAAVALHAKSSQQTTAGSISNVEASPTTDSTNRTRFDGHSKGYHDGIECGGISDDDNDDIDSGTSEPENCKEQTAPVIDDENEPLHQDDVEKIGSAKSTICVPSMSKKLLSFGIGADTISSIELVDPFGLLYVGEKGVVQVWDIKQSNATTTMKSAVLDCKTNAFVRFTKIAPDRKTLVVGGQFDKLVFFDLQTNTIKMTADVASLKSAAISAVITSDARSLVTAHQSGHIDLWDIRQGRLVLNLGKHLDAAVGCNVLNSNGPENTFVSGSVDGTIATWDSRACGTDSQTSLYVTMHSVNAPIYSLSNDPTRPGICSVGLSNGSLEVWNLSTNAPWPVKLLPNAHQKSILGVNYSRDGSWVLSMASRSFKAWSTETFEQLVETEIEDAMFCDVSGCGKYVVTGSSKATISLFELQSESPI